jgi:streptomycin 6-kinase
MRSNSTVIDAATRRRLIERFGLWADEWCDALPKKLDQLTRQWRLRIESPLSTGQTSCVFLCRRSGDNPAVLKISPERDLTVTEAAALTAWQPSGRLPRLFETDVETGALLMEAIRPGTTLGKGRAVAYLEEVAELVSALGEAPAKRSLPSFRL